MTNKFIVLINNNDLISSLVASIIFSIVVYLFNSDCNQLIYLEDLNEKIIDFETGKGFRIYGSALKVGE